MYYFEGVIVVEGKGDVCFLSSFIDSEYVILNGYEIPEDTVIYLKNIKNRKILLCTDPDEAGEKIRTNFKKKNIECIDVLFDLKSCNKKGKHGVAECNKIDALKTLEKHLTNKPLVKTEISQAEFEELGLIFSKDKQNYLKFMLKLGNCNTKTLLKRINYNNISKNDIKQILDKEYGNK